MKKQHLLLASLCLAFFFSCTKDVQQNTQASDELAGVAGRASDVSENAGGNYEPNELLIKFKGGTSEDAKAAVFARISSQVKERILTAAMKHSGDNEGVYLVHTPLHALEAISKAKGIEVDYAEPNWIYTHDAVSNDTYYTNGSLWGMYSDDLPSAVGGSGTTNIYGSRAEEAWAAGKTGSSTVYVGIIDEGAMNTHEDLAGNFAFGYDFVNNDNSTFDGVEDDHGTHVAGTIGAIGGNGKGVAGVTWNTKMISAKFLGRNGGTTANAVKSVDYITGLKSSTVNIVATNNSWGGGGYSKALYDAIARANAANILFIAAAGNSGTDNDETASYPSNYNLPNVIAVAAIDKTGALASFSQYGATTVDLGAPGVGIWSTLPKRSQGQVVSGYGSYSGTSMATPHVTGGAALYASTHAGATAAQIKSAILSSALSTPSLSGKTVTGGRLNVSGF